MNEIDLSKITVKEIPSKVIKANFDGTEKEFTIFEMTDAQLAQLATMRLDRGDYNRVRTCIVFMLSAGLQIPFTTAEFLFDNVPEESVRVAQLIDSFGVDLQEAKNKEAVEAEKNSVTETQNP